MAEYVTLVVGSVFAVYSFDKEACVLNASTGGAEMSALLEKCIALKTLINWRPHGNRP
jgi:hypothetical protein